MFFYCLNVNKPIEVETEPWCSYKVYSY